MSTTGRLRFRTRPLALGALTFGVGLSVGFSGRLLDFLLLLGFASLMLGGLAWVRGERAPMTIAALLGLFVLGAVIGREEVRRAAGDCRRAWKNGERVELTGVALTFLPGGEQGSARVRPVGRAENAVCVWVGSVRIFTEGPIAPGRAYRLAGRWRAVGRPGRLPVAPERRGWVAVDRLRRVEAGRAIRPLLWVRGWAAGGLWRLYPRRWAPWAEALVLGGRETVDPEVYRRLIDAGLAHLLAISGLHVGLLAAALLSLARVCRLSLTAARSATMVAVGGYVLLIGAPASALRAALMLGLWTLCRVAGRPSSFYDVAGLAAMSLVAVDPWAVIGPGFQLSFAGAGAVAFAHATAGRSGWLRARSSFVRVLALGLSVSLATTVLTAPITAYHFGRFVPAAVPGNLAAIPLVGLAMPALFLSALLSFWPAVASWPAGAAVTLLHAIEALSSLLSSLPWGSLEVPRPGLLSALTVLVLIGLGARALGGPWERRRFIWALGFVAAIAILVPVLPGPGARGHLAVYVLDVGQGEAIALETPNGRWALVDAGPRAGGFDAGQRRVVPFLRSRGVRRLEVWFISHPDLDHVGGGPAVLDAVEVRRVVSPGHVTGQAGQIPVLERLAGEGIEWLRGASGASLGLDGLRVRFLHPDRRRPDPVDRLTEGSNAESLVFLLEYGSFRMIFTGDIPSRVEEELVREVPDALRASVLKVAHHGSASSTLRRFLDAVQPELAVISVGRSNRYGHPSPFVLQRLAERSIPVRRTDRDGMLVIEAHPDGRWRVRSAAEGF